MYGFNITQMLAAITLKATAVTALLNPVTGALKGLMTASDYNKLGGIASGATLNSSDAFLLARGNHTGTQLAATISDLGTAATKDIHVGTSAPGSPDVNDLWVDTN